MKKFLATLGLALALTFSASAQWIHGVFASSSSAGGIDAVMADGNAIGWYIAESEYLTLTGTSNDSVSQWDDASIAGNDLTQGTMVNRPIFSGDSVYFDGTNDYLIKTLVSYSHPATYYAVINEITNVNFDDMVSFPGGTSGGIRQTGTLTTKGLWGGGTGVGVTGFPGMNTWYILRVVWGSDGADASKTQINNNAAVTGTLDVNASVSNFSIPASSGSPANISVKEVIYRSGIDSDADQTTILDYLNGKYSIY